MVNVLFFIFRRKKIKYALESIDWNVKTDIYQIIFIVVAIVLSFNKSQDIRTISDMGIYFERSVVLTGNNTSSIQELKEYGKISDSVDNGLCKLQDELIGLYQFDDNADNTSFSYEYHSLPTWVTFMALFGRIFGLFNAPHVLTWFYVLASICLYYLIENISKNKLNKFFSIALFSFSPIIIYLSKTTLTEMSFLMLLFIGLLFLSEKNIFASICGGIAIGLLGFVHISMCMYIPIFFVSLFLLSFFFKRKDYAIANIVQCLMYMLSLPYVYKVSSIYTSQQLSRFGSYFSTIQIICGLMLLNLMFIGIQFAGMALVNCQELYRQIKQWLTIILDRGSLVGLIIILLGTVYEAYCLGFTDKYSHGDGSWWLRSVYAGKGFGSLIHINFVSIVMATSFICIPIIIIWQFHKTEKSILEKIVYLVVLYSWAIYTFLQVDTPSNYYASRYYAIILVPAVILLMSLIIKKEKYTLGIIAIAIIINIPFNIHHLQVVAFDGQHNLYKEVTEHIAEGSTVLLPEGTSQLNSILTNNLRLMNSNEVYNLENINEVMTFYDKKQNYYIISEIPLELNGWELIFEKNFSLYGNISTGGIPYPVKMNSYNMVSCYIYTQ
ncbi:hypothetical protein NSA48_13365 [Frisingicoccus caecimuris]|nr:hypothetical protein [Frisingicoccus caecimuris]